jgi:hypothetical protein
MEQIIYTYSEFKQIEKKIQTGYEILIKIVSEFNKIYPGIAIDLENFDAYFIEGEYLKSKLPDEINGLPVNKDEILKQVQRHDLSEIKTFIDAFNTFVALEGINSSKCFIKRNNEYFINTDYLSELKRLYSIYATLPEQKHMIASYIYLKDAINKFNTNAEKYYCNQIMPSIPLSHLFEFSEGRVNIKPAILDEIIKTIKN